jgi:hypothetical protein
MEGGPPGSPCRRRSQTTAVSCRSRAGVGSDCGDGPLSAGQVSDEKTNMCKPLLTHRKYKRRHRNRGSCPAPGQGCALSGVSGARELPARGPGGVRCKGGVSSLQALARNRRICRFDTNDWLHPVLSAPWSSRGRSSGGQGQLSESTDARHRGGPARSSDEGPVMELEQRGWAGQVTYQSTLRGTN